MLAAAPPTLPQSAGRPVEFVRDVAPIFAKACQRCHGETKQKGGYRLDVKAVALKGGDQGPAIVPGDSAGSPLIQYVAGVEADMVMPPTGDRLTPAQIGVLRAWIDQGAVWPDATAGAGENGLQNWWSLRPLVRPALPTLEAADAARVRNPVDAFILAKLREKGLAPAPEADRRTLVRRLSFDLVGLPPDPDEVDAFVADADPRAYETLVDRLLDSPHYGERWARHWLDVVHYGETHGYDKDKPRPNAWPYRDYVIRAFNTDKPYARFVQEQVAGDVLCPGTADGIEALGFIAAGPWDFIGHAEVPETKVDGKIARHLDRDDMVANTINTFNSLTVHCAQCHNHKFDPIPQEDYYRLQAVFAALDRADRSYDPDPAIGARRAALLTRLNDLERSKKRLDDQLSQRGGEALAALDRRIEAAGRPPGAPSPEFGYHSGIEPVADRPKWVQVDLGHPWAIATIAYTGCYDDFNGIGAGFGFPARFKVEVADDPAFREGVRLIEDQTGADVPNPGTQARSVPVGGPPARFVRVTASKLALRQADYMFALAELSVHDATGRNLATGATVSALDSIEAPPRWGRKNLVDGIAPGQSPGPAAVGTLKAERQALIAHLLDAQGNREFEEVEKGLASARAAVGKLPPARLVYAGTVYNGGGAFLGTGASGGKPRVVRMLSRGDVRKPGKEVEPGALSALAGLPSRFELSSGHTEGDRRAALAGWLTAPENPLTWRSIVNRVWLYHFGRGIVDSPNDFGRMGQLPTHPELLDWLAVEFRDHGQSLKQLHRLLVTSATYRQSAATDPKALTIDSGNAYYWHGHRRRLEAEAIRDSMLQVSGKLNATMFGPSFQDFVVVKPEHSPHYEYQLHDPEDLKSHRRSIYRFIVRSQQQPFLTTMDCADPSLLVDKRNQTITPLQALALRNNPLTVVMARHFAARVARSSAEPSEQITTAYRLALARPPSEEERQTLVAYASRHGLANACRALLNLNEFVFVD